MNLFLAALIVFIINLPFGYLRAGVKKLSFRWFLYIHLPVPLVILIRHLFDLGFALYTYPVMVGAFFLGQFVGKKINKKPYIEKKELQ